MNIVEWFNTNDPVHVRAWRHLHEKGEWPTKFLPANIAMTPEWHHGIAMKLAECWVDRIIHDDDSRKRHEKLDLELEKRRKQKIAAKPKKDQVLELMADGWELYSCYLGARGHTKTWYLQNKKTSQNLDVNGNTAEALVKAKKIECLPNLYPSIKSTEWKLMEG